MSPRPIDPQGKRALFEQPVSAPRDQISAGGSTEGKAALFSTGPARPGTVVIECSSCETRSRVSLLDAGIRLLQLSVWLPLRHHSRLIRCPGCHQRTWCRIHWLS